MSRLGYALSLAVMTCVFVVVAVRANKALAADIRIDHAGPAAAIVLEGPIVPGDAQRLKAVLNNAMLMQTPLSGLVLNSSGGSFDEARKIAESFIDARKHGVRAEAMVMANDICASACFLIFACAPRRYADIAAHIGLHSARDKDNSEDAGAYVVDTWMARIAGECGVPDYLIGKMITTRAGSMYWLTTQDLFAMGAHVVQNGQELSAPAPQAPAPQASTPPTPTPQALPKCNAGMRFGCVLYALVEGRSGDVFYCMRQKALLYGCHW